VRSPRSLDTPLAAAGSSGTTTSPQERDRFFSTMRAFAVLALMVVHWGLAVTFSNGLSQIGIDRFTVLPSWLTWVFVWIGPVWFGMFGALNLRGVRKALRTHSLQAFYRKRLTRLLIPYYAYAAVFVLLELGLKIGGVGQCADPAAGTDLFFRLDAVWKWFTWLLPFPHVDCLGLGQAPFWFMSVYIFLTLVFPLLVKLYDRTKAVRLPFGREIASRYAIVLGFVAVSFAFDLLGRILFTYQTGATPLMPFQMIVVWGFFGFLGFFYAEKEHDQPFVKEWAGRIGVGLTLATGLMVIGPYPDALWDGTGGNQFPPTAAYVTGGLASVCFMLRARNAITKFSRLPLVEPAVNALEKYNYTVYIWHMAALQLVWWGTKALGWHETLVFSDVEHPVNVLFDLSIPLSQLLFFVLSWPFLVLLVRVFYRAESWTLPAFGGRQFSFRRVRSETADQ